MKEYRIVVQNGNAKPYSLWTFSSFDCCYVKLLEFIQDKSTQLRPEYYVINSFYKNKYPALLGTITTYKIECREVTEWNLYSKEVEEKRENSKIIYFNKFYKKALTK